MLNRIIIAALVLVACDSPGSSGSYEPACELEMSQVCEALDRCAGVDDWGLAGWSENLPRPQISNDPTLSLGCTKLLVAGFYVDGDYLVSCRHGRVPDCAATVEAAACEPDAGWSARSGFSVLGALNDCAEHIPER